jgi:DNA-binding CsgD family transcriptional regulator
MTNVILNVGGITTNSPANGFADELSDEIDETPPPNVEAMSSAERTALLLENLDVGLALVSSTGKLLKKNSNATQMLAAFGKNHDVVPPALWQKLDAVIAAGTSVPGRFTPSSPINSPRGRYFVRVRVLRGGALVMSIAPAALREIDVSRVLTEKFGLTAQEIRIAFFAAQGYRNREIADRLEVVEGTVKNYLTNVFSALSVRSRTELASELAQLVDEQDHRLEK